MYICSLLFDTKKRVILCFAIYYVSWHNMLLQQQQKNPYVVLKIQKTHIMLHGSVLGSPVPAPSTVPHGFYSLHKKSNATPVIIIIICCFVVISLALVSYYFIWKRKRKRSGYSFYNGEDASKNRQGTNSSIVMPATSDSRKNSSELNGIPHPVRNASRNTTEVLVFTYKQLSLATNKFSESNVIGTGGFGLVYRSVLPDGRVAAIKQLDRDGKQGEREFRVEVDLLSRLNSPYLLQLLGYCADLDHRLLVYEYMPNGNLQEHIYTDALPGSPPFLDWSTRMRIALDAARGLQYLHEGTSPPIIHRDFKTSNVLLDKNYNAKVSDFGLAKLGSDKLHGQVSTRVLGTMGYVAPEYALTGHLTVKSDVYSFGVVLLELLTGRVPVDMKRPPGEGVLVYWAIPFLSDRERVAHIIDPALKGQYSKKDLLQVASIASMCVQADPDYRPLMTDVVQALHPYVKQGSRSMTTSSPNFQHHVVTIRSSSLDSGSSGTR